jgi:hypothetical protein
VLVAVGQCVCVCDVYISFSFLIRNVIRTLQDA